MKNNLTNEEEAMFSMMTKAIEEKTKCMINSYSAVLVDTEQMLNYHFDAKISPEEVMKRVDMFWSLALQRTDRDIAMAEQKSMSVNQGNPQKRGISPKDLEIMEKRRNPGQESPCAKKARENAEEITRLKEDAVEKAKHNKE